VLLWKTKEIREYRQFLNYSILGDHIPIKKIIHYSLVVAICLLEIKALSPYKTKITP